MINKNIVLLCFVVSIVVLGAYMTKTHHEGGCRDGTVMEYETFVTRYITKTSKSVTPDNSFQGRLRGLQGEYGCGPSVSYFPLDIGAITVMLGAYTFYLYIREK